MYVCFISCYSRDLEQCKLCHWRISLHPKGEKLLRNCIQVLVPVTTTSLSEDGSCPKIFSTCWPLLGSREHHILCKVNLFPKSRSQNSH